MTGCLLAGFFLIGGIGIDATSRLAATVNLSIGAAAIVMAYRGSATVQHLPRGTADTARLARESAALPASPAHWLIFGAFVLSGLASLALEVIWFRTLVLYYPATTYAFTAMLATVLAGIAVEVCSPHRS